MSDRSAAAQVLACPDFNLEATLESGQVFHWSRDATGAWEGLAGDRVLRVRQEGAHLVVLEGDAALAARYFALDHPMSEICATFPGDTTMQAAAEYCRGLRLIRQPLWECLATFITSSMKQVSHIRAMSLALRERFGRPVPGARVRAYPLPEALAEAPEEALRACGLGYRAPGLRATAARVAESAADLEAWRGLDDETLRGALCALPGVGRKIANCVMLFAYERLAAFPVDTWIQRILRESYWRGRRRAGPHVLERRLSGRFGPYAGYAQQYLFHHARMTRRAGGRS